MVRCIQCGVTRRGERGRRCDAVPLDISPGLGDYTESLLKSIGITQARYVAAKQLFGLAPTCGCDARKEWLNRVSDWWRGERRSN